MFYENLWMRSLSRGDDVRDEYGICKEIKDKIIDRRLKYILRTRNSWDKYCTHKEDIFLRSSKWDGLIDIDERVIMHDTTSLRMTYKPSGGRNQRITWNSYYHGNVAKGGVSLQLCGWIVVDHLWVGAFLHQHSRPRVQASRACFSLWWTACQTTSIQKRW